MRYNRIGSTDLAVSALGFGCAPIGSRSGRLQSSRALKKAFDRGINFFDTADMYGVGGSEQALGRVFGGVRDQVVISTKCGYRFSSRLKSLRWVKPLIRPLVQRLSGVKSTAGRFIASQTSQSFEPDYVEQCVHNSLSRLRTDYIDLFFLHDPPSAIAERSDTFAKLQSLKDAGKIRHYGISCDVEVAAHLLRCCDFDFSAVQVNLNLLEQDAVHSVLPLAVSRQIGVVARGPFGHGKLLEKLTDLKMLDEFGLPPDCGYASKLALRFVLQFKEISSILASMVHPHHLELNIAAVDGAPLSDKERALVHALGAGPGSRGTAC
ncbi:MAG: aldo/keto reductase [Phycisphaerales bacterium]|nr:aldo/keto reductase [Phycisphaerales bacterium]